jgi:hypothetical protein
MEDSEKRPPRPVRPIQARRGKVIQITVFEDEFAALTAAAALARIPLATWARAELLRAAEEASK